MLLPSSCYEMLTQKKTFKLEKNKCLKNKTTKNVKVKLTKDFGGTLNKKTIKPIIPLKTNVLIPIQTYNVYNNNFR